MTLFKAIAQGRGARAQCELNSAETKDLRIFKSWSWGILNHVCLLIGFTTKKSKLALFFVTGDCFTTCSKAPTKVRLLFFHRNWEIGVLFSLMTTFQRYYSQVFDKDIPGL